MTRNANRARAVGHAACLGFLLLGAGNAAARALPALEDAAGPASASSSQTLTLAGFASKRNLAIGLIGGAATWVAYRIEDAPAQAQFLGRGPLDVGSDVGNAYGDGRLLAAGTLGLWAAGRIGENPALTGAGGDVAKALALSVAMVWPLKLGVDRTRPDGGQHSFPSGHAACAFAVAPVLAHRFGRKISIPAYTLAAFTAAGRMEDRRHYLSDVVCGATIGLIAGETVVHGRHDLRLLEYFGFDRRGAQLRFEF